MLGTLVASCLVLSACGGGDPSDGEDTVEQPLHYAGRQQGASGLTVTNMGNSTKVTPDAEQATMPTLAAPSPAPTAVVSTPAPGAALPRTADPTPAPVPTPEPPPDPSPEASLASLPVKIDLLSRIQPTSGCAEGYLPGSEVNAPAIPVTNVALTHTPSEVAMWRSRTVSGPFVTPGDYTPGSPGDWARITNSARAFLSSGEATITRLADDPARTTHGAKARDAAFVYLITSDRNYLTAVRDYLIAQTKNPANDFTKLCLRNGDGSVRDAWFLEAGWLLRQIVTYDYVRSALALADRQAIENWIRRNAYFFAVQIDRGMVSIFPKRLQGNYATRAGAAAATTDSQKWATKRFDTNSDCKVDASDSPKSFRLALYTRADGSSGPYVSVLSQYFNNRKSANALAFGGAGALLGDTELINRSKRYFLEWLTYSVWPDGAQGEYARNGEYCVPRQGITYSTINSQAALMFSDWMARRDDTSLFNFSTRDGLFGTESGSTGNAKSISRSVSTYLDLINSKLNWYMNEPWKTAQQPRTATFLGQLESRYNGSPKVTDDFHDLGYLIGAEHMPASMNVPGNVMRDPKVTALRFPGSTGNAVDTGFGAGVGAWTDALGALPSVFLLRP